MSSFRSSQPSSPSRLGIGVVTSEIEGYTYDDYEFEPLERHQDCSLHQYMEARRRTEHETKPGARYRASTACLIHSDGQGGSRCFLYLPPTSDDRCNFTLNDGSFP